MTHNGMKGMKKSERVRVTNACVLCKEKKTKCDLDRPCGRCKANGWDCVSKPATKRGPRKMVASTKKKSVGGPKKASSEALSPSFSSPSLPSLPSLPSPLFSPPSSSSSSSPFSCSSIEEQAKEQLLFEPNACETISAAARANLEESSYDEFIEYELLSSTNPNDNNNNYYVKLGSPLPLPQTEFGTEPPNPGLLSQQLSEGENVDMLSIMTIYQQYNAQPEDGQSRINDGLIGLTGPECIDDRLIGLTEPECIENGLILPTNFFSTENEVTVYEVISDTNNNFLYWSQ